MGGEEMRKSLAVWWRKITSWLSVLGAAHVVDDGVESREKPAKADRSTLYLVPRHR